ncbi:MAG: L-2-hydroxyglutarate oxidase [Actinobacteria bacterium]|nr:MAG: L-2-hydroxyglutarate oxidase [Actinomycetota bacterium]
MTAPFDVAVIGAGIVGLATARAVLEQHPGASVAVLDKELVVGSHQTGHNSGVLHSGLYYRPGSLKARLCVEGRRSMVELCQREGIPFVPCGKLVVATSTTQLGALDELERRGTGNGLSGLRRVAADEITGIEPHARGVDALHVPEAGIVDFVAVAGHVAAALDGDVLLGHAVEAIQRRGGVTAIGTSAGSIRCRVVVNCAGLQADRVAALAGVDPPVRIVPFRGEYYTLAAEAAARVSGLLYPVPDPRLPFLGVHFTRRIDGSVEVGPNAVLALGREHYRGARPNLRDLAGTLAYRGFLRMVARHWRTGAGEIVRSLSRSAYAGAASSLLPGVLPEHLIRGRIGIRAQAVTPQGDLADDFIIMEAPGAIHVLNAPSPGATASLAIGAHLAQSVGRHLGSEGTNRDAG